MQAIISPSIHRKSAAEDRYSNRSKQLVSKSNTKVSKTEAHSRKGFKLLNKSVEQSSLVLNQKPTNNLTAKSTNVKEQN